MEAATGEAVATLRGIVGDQVDVEMQIGIICRLVEHMRSKTQTELLEAMNAPSVALLVGVGFADTTPLTFTAEGWRWLKLPNETHRRGLLRLAIEQRRSVAAATSEVAA